MSAEDPPFTCREEQLLDTPGGMARVLWYRYWRNLRLYMRAEAAQIEHDILYGTGDPTKMPIGILHVAGLQRAAR